MSPDIIKKNWSGLLLPFIAGVILTALAFSFLGGNGNDLQGDYKNKIAQVAPSANNANAVCNTSNCDLMAKLNLMHGNGGNSTWNLESMALLTGIMSQNTTNAINGYSTWTLGSLASNILGYEQNSQTPLIVSVKGINGNGDISSWSLESIAQQIFSVCSN